MEKFNVKRRALKQPKPRPIKVVYISNPMKVEASPADFRAVVQELTGRDSDIAYMFGCPSTSVAAKSSCTHAADNESTVDLPVDMFDDDFTSQILEDFRRNQSCDNGIADYSSRRIELNCLPTLKKLVYGKHSNLMYNILLEIWNCTVTAP